MGFMFCDLHVSSSGGYKFVEFVLYTASDPVSLVPNSVTTILGFSLIGHEFSLTTVTKLLRQHQ